MDKARLKCRAIGIEDGDLIVEGHTIDGDTFSMKLTGDMRSYNPETKECWIEVDYFGKSGGRAAIGLPVGDIRMGKNVTVSVHDIDRTEEVIKALEEKAKKARLAGS